MAARVARHDEEPPRAHATRRFRASRGRRIVAVVSSAMAARKTEEGHGGHAGGSKNHAEDVEVHFSMVSE